MTVSSAPPTPPARVLIVAGSDSSGGAGIQADIKTVTMLGGYAMTAITALTAQNTLGVTAVETMSADMVADQIRACLDDIGADAVKTGMIGSAAQIRVLAAALDAYADRHGAALPLIVDPVMIATSGAALMQEETLAALTGTLLPRAAVVTPNAPELARLTGMAADSEKDVAAAARALSERHGIAVLAKGAHLPGPEVVDLLVQPGADLCRWAAPRLPGGEFHGTGCTLASGVAAGLAAGLSLAAASARARAFVRAAIAAAPGLGGGSTPLAHEAVDLSALQG